MEIKKGRKFLRFYDQEEYEKNVPESDQTKKRPSPPIELPFPPDSKLIDLTPPEELSTTQSSFLSIVNSRVSRRKFLDESITLEELSYLLWCTQGVKRQVKLGAFRTVPSAGARGPLETYLFIGKVEGINPGIYRYISLQHKLLFIKKVDHAEEVFTHLAFEQDFASNGAVLFIWVAVPYRTEWRYTILAHKFIAIDLGIVCENLYLACEARKLGTVAIGYYEQKKLDNLLELDPEEAFSVLIAPVGKIAQKSDVRKFLTSHKSDVPSETLNLYLGPYKIPDGPQVDILLENGKLIISSDMFSEPLTPHSETEFFGGDIIRAVRFVLNEYGKVQKMIVLPGLISDKDLIEMIKI